MSYRTEVINDNPLGYWPMSDAIGATTMTAVIGSNGTYTNGPVLGNAGALKSSSETSAKFDGVNDYASVAIDLSGQSRILVEFWANIPSYANDDKLTMEYTANSNSSKGFLINLDSSSPANVSTIQFTNGDSTNYWVDSFTRQAANTWLHYACDFDRTNHVNLLYINGQSVSLSASTHSNVSYGNFANSTLYLMSRAGTSLFCTANSLMCQLAIYSGGLSAARVMAHYTAGSAPIAFNNYQFVRADSGISVTEKIR